MTTEKVRYYNTNYSFKELLQNVNIENAMTERVAVFGKAKRTGEGARPVRVRIL